MKNLPIHGAARRLAVFPVFCSGQKHAANKKRTAKMTVRCTSHFGFGNGKTKRHGAQRI